MELWDGSKDGYVASRFVIEEEGEGVKNWMNQRLLEKVGEGEARNYNGKLSASSSFSIAWGDTACGFGGAGTFLPGARMAGRLASAVQARIRPCSSHREAHEGHSLP
ncbi:hypothetical protein Q3G72_023878 [Acer saccharum]|nr:hypothetical protein Q3G72_023878 [Acer saccharum]